MIFVLACNVNNLMRTFRKKIYLMRTTNFACNEMDKCHAFPFSIKEKQRNLCEVLTDKPSHSTCNLEVYARLVP